MLKSRPAPGLADPVLYKYFEGKEDLLFSIADRRMKEGLVSLGEALGGISQAESQLSKMIWWHLNYNESNPGTSLVDTAGVPGQSEFLPQPGYENIRQYAALIQGVLDQGIRSGEFRDDVTMYLVRDLIFGTIDFETVSLLGTGEVESITADLEDIVMIRAMIQRKEAPGISPDNKEERILRAAEKVFAAKGFNKAKD